MYDYLKNQKTHFISIQNIVPALHWNLCAEVKFYFTARSTEGTESIDIKTTDISSVLCPWLIPATIRAILYQCAAVISRVMCHRHVSHDIECAAIDFVIFPPLNYVELHLPGPDWTSHSCAKSRLIKSIFTRLSHVWRVRQSRLPKWHVSNCGGYQHTKFETNPSIRLVCSLD